MNEGSLARLQRELLDPFVAAAQAIKADQPSGPEQIAALITRLSGYGHSFTSKDLKVWAEMGAPLSVTGSQPQRIALMIACFSEIYRYVMSQPVALEDTQVVQAIYRAYSEFYDLPRGKEEHWVAMADFVARLIPAEMRARGARVVDLACGSGRSALLFRPLAARLVGVDLSPEMLVLAARKNLYDQLVTARIEDFLTENDDPIDIIGCYNLMQIYRDARGLISIIHDRLPVGGLFVFSIHWARLNGAEHVLAGDKVLHDRARIERHIDETGGRILGVGVVRPGQSCDGIAFQNDLVVAQKT